MDDNNHNLECGEKRERAERTLNEVLDELASRCPLLPDHIEAVRTTPISLACEEVPQLEEVLQGVEGIPSWLLSKEDKSSLDSCKMKLSWFRDEEFLYWYFGRAIIIGVAGEALPDREYKQTMVAEVAHAIAASAGPYREGEFILDLGVGEFYDYSLTLLYDSDAELSENIRTSKLASLYKSYSKQSSSLQEAALKATPEVLSVLLPGQPPLSEEELKFFTTFAFDCFLVLEADPDHVDAAIIAYELFGAVSQYLGCSDKEALLYLPKIACKALYDTEVDFSSPEQFVETVKPRLPEYLNNG